MHAGTFSENPEALNMPSIHTDFWDPVFTAACDTETVLCCHVGSASRGAQTSTDAPPSVTMALGAASVISTFGELLWANFWERFPALKFSLTEGDIGWIPYFLARAEHVQKRHSGWTMHSFPNDGTPKDIFLEHMLCCFISEDVGIELIDRFNIDNVCWESDYPHSDCDWPNAPEVVAQVMEPLTDVQVAKITHENAMRHYHFDPFATRPREQCTVAALRAESPDVDPDTRVGRLATERDAQIFKYALRGIKVPAGGAE